MHDVVIIDNLQVTFSVMFISLDPTELVAMHLYTPWSLLSTARKSTLLSTTEKLEFVFKVLDDEATAIALFPLNLCHATEGTGSP